jgi:hypothetical protein
MNVGNRVQEKKKMVEKLHQNEPARDKKLSSCERNGNPLPRRPRQMLEFTSDSIGFSRAF